MVRRITAAVNERRDENFIICARTDAAGIHGVEEAIERAKAYADAGADMLFTEALYAEEDFAKFRAAVDIPLVANMTECEKTKLLSAKKIQELGYNAVIWPVSTLRVAMGATEEFLRDMQSEVLQSEEWLDRMQHRSRLYELVDRKSTRLNSSHVAISYAVFCLK